MLITVTAVAEDLSCWKFFDMPIYNTLNPCCLLLPVDIICARGTQANNLGHPDLTVVHMKMLS